MYQLKKEKKQQSPQKVLDALEQKKQPEQAQLLDLGISYCRSTDALLDSLFSACLHSTWAYVAFGLL